MMQANSLRSPSNGPKTHIKMALNSATVAQATGIPLTWTLNLDLSVTHPPCPNSAFCDTKECMADPRIASVYEQARELTGTHYEYLQMVRYSPGDSSQVLMHNRSLLSPH